MIFPEGTRSRKGSLLEGKKGILLIARMSGVPIIPIGIHGTEKLLPINEDGNMAAEVFSHAEVCVNIGNQFELPERLDNQDKKQYDEYALNDMMKKIAELLSEKYQGVYGNHSL